MKERMKREPKSSKSLVFRIIAHENKVGFGFCAPH